MVGFLLVIALVVIALLLVDVKKLKYELRAKSYSMSGKVTSLNNMIDYKDGEIKKLKIEKQSLCEGYEKDIVIYKKAVEDKISFTEAKLKLDEHDKAIARQKEEIRQKAFAEKSKRQAAERKSKAASNSSRNTSNSSSSNSVWDDFDGGYRSSSSGSNSSSNSSYSGGGGDFGGGGSGGSWSD